jgi:hypothetical protein
LRKAAKRSLQFFRGGSKFRVNIGIFHQLLIGRTERGFDFLGYHFGPEGLAIGQKTLNNFVERATRLYEQGPGESCGSTRLWEYVKRWVRWAGVGIGNLAREIHPFSIKYENVFLFKVEHCKLFGIDN